MSNLRSTVKCSLRFYVTYIKSTDDLRELSVFDVLTHTLVTFSIYQVINTHLDVK